MDKPNDNTETEQTIKNPIQSSGIYNFTTIGKIEPKATVSIPFITEYFK